MPSEVFHRNLWSTFMHVRHICWSTDYPHAGTDWPNSRRNIERLFRGVPRDEVKLMLHSNAKALYGLHEVADQRPAPTGCDLVSPGPATG